MCKHYMMAVIIIKPAFLKNGGESINLCIQRQSSALLGNTLVGKQPVRLERSLVEDRKGDLVRRLQRRGQRRRFLENEKAAARWPWTGSEEARRTRSEHHTAPALGGAAAGADGAAVPHSDPTLTN